MMLRIWYSNRFIRMPHYAAVWKRYYQLWFYMYAVCTILCTSWCHLCLEGYHKMYRNIRWAWKKHLNNSQNQGPNHPRVHSTIMLYDIDSYCITQQVHSWSMLEQLSLLDRSGNRQQNTQAFRPALTKKILPPLFLHWEFWGKVRVSVYRFLLFFV